MIRGTQREMIMLKGDKNSAFESVFFIVRTDLHPTTRKKEDMLFEANKILAESVLRGKSAKRPLWRKMSKKLPAFSLGAILGALVCTLFRILL